MGAQGPGQSGLVRSAYEFRIILYSLECRTQSLGAKALALSFRNRIRALCKEEPLKGAS